MQPWSYSLHGAKKGPILQPGSNLVGQRLVEWPQDPVSKSILSPALMLYARHMSRSEKASCPKGSFSP